MSKNIIQYTLYAALIFFSGCATSNQTEDNITEYDTDVVPAKFSFDSSSLADDAAILYRVQVHSGEKNEAPTKAELSFLVRPGSNDLYLKSRTLSIQANGHSYKWPGREWIDVFQSPPLRGIITTVRLSYDDLGAIANTREVKGNLGGQNFEWSYESREPIRNLMSRVNSHTRHN